MSGASLISSRREDKQAPLSIDVDDFDEAEFDRDGSRRRAFLENFHVELSEQSLQKLRCGKLDPSKLWELDASCRARSRASSSDESVAARLQPVAIVPESHADQSDSDLSVSLSTRPALGTGLTGLAPAPAVRGRPARGERFPDSRPLSGAHLTRAFVRSSNRRDSSCSKKGTANTEAKASTIGRTTSQRLIRVATLASAPPATRLLQSKRQPFRHGSGS